VVTNVCAKFNHDRLRTDKPLGKTTANRPLYIAGLSPVDYLGECLIITIIIIVYYEFVQIAYIT